MGQPNPDYPKRKKMVVYEVVEQKEPEKRENPYWWFGPLLAFIFIVVPFGTISIWMAVTGRILNH